jgi:hypothetical protein
VGVCARLEGKRRRGLERRSLASNGGKGAKMAAVALLLLRRSTALRGRRNEQPRRYSTR